MPISRRALAATTLSAALAAAEQRWQWSKRSGRSTTRVAPIAITRKTSGSVSVPVTVPRRLQAAPVTVARNALVVDLTDFDPTKKIPGWDGRKASQNTVAAFPQDRDLVVLGHRSAVWTGGGFVRGGRNVTVTGGTYTNSMLVRNFMGNASVEGVLVRMPWSAVAHETGDGISVHPDAKTLGASAVIVLNCRVENIDGLKNGKHGDVFQLSSAYDAPNGYSSCPKTVLIERLTGTSAYQGLFLANQHFDSHGYDISTKSVELRDVNLRPSRADGGRCMIYMIDTTSSARGDRPYPKKFTNVYVEPYARERIEALVSPSASAAPVPSVGIRLGSIVDALGRTLTFPAAMLLDGAIQYGAPSGGDFARQADTLGRGGLDVPGIGYTSPGYGAS